MWKKYLSMQIWYCTIRSNPFLYPSLFYENALFSHTNIYVLKRFYAEYQKLKEIENKCKNSRNKGAFYSFA